MPIAIMAMMTAMQIEMQATRFVLAFVKVPKILSFKTVFA